TPGGMVLWTRLAPDPLAPDGTGGMPPRPVAVLWEVAEDERFSRVVHRGLEVTRPETAHSVHAEVDGLRPGREYFYRFRAEAEISPVGRTRTAPAAGSTTPLRLGFASCSMFEHGYFTAYRHMAEDDLDLMVHLGDYIYEYAPSEYRSPTGNVRAFSNGHIHTLADYRVRHAQYRTDPDLQAAHGAAPWIVTWDDHEVDNNWADEVPEEDGQTREAFLARRAAALQAYWENMPLRPSMAPVGIDLPLHRRLAWGSLASFHVLDTRQYRSDQACGDRTRIDCAERLDPSRTITGDDQERWLVDGLARSTTTWNVLAQQVVFAQRDFEAGPVQRFSMDAWDGYKASRDRVMAAIVARGPEVLNPVVLTGDVHVNYAADLKADFEDPASATTGVELIGTSVTSGGNGADTTAGGETVLRENPHFRFFNAQRGYVRCTVTPGQWRADYRVLPYVTSPGAPASTRASFVTEAARPGLQAA
ncbi:MAG: alkaline phosphatase D family protein, partial [Acidimicrobiales bacterium]